MTAALLAIVADLLCLWVSMAMQPCNVTISPEDPAVAFGAPVTLNCTTSCANYTDLKWETSLTPKIQEGNGWISLRIQNVTEWKARPLCWVKLEDTLLDTTRAVLYVYEFSAPALDLVSEVQHGHTERVACRVSKLKVRDSFPSHMNISLGIGQGVLRSTQNRSSVEYSFVADLQKDDRAEVFCEAYVQVGSEVLRKQTKEVLNVVAHPFNISISTNRERYSANANIKVTCNATGKPSPVFLWDLPSTDGVKFSDANQSIEIPSAQRSHSGTYRCLANNIYGEVSAQKDIIFEESTRSWVAAVVVVTLLAALFTAGFFWYRCQK